MKLTEEDFGYFNAEADLGIPEELSIIKRGCKAKEISDQILADQEKAERYDKLKNEQGIDDIIRQRMLILNECDFNINKILENQRLRELVEERLIEFNIPVDTIYDHRLHSIDIGVGLELQSLLSKAKGLDKAKEI